MIRFYDVTKRFGDKLVLDGLNLHIPEGKVTFILGKSGEGKSVTIKHIMGLLQPTSGRIVVDGDCIGEYSKSELRHYRQKFGMLFQHAALFDGMSVRENVLFPLREQSKLPRDAQQERVEEVLQQVGLPEIQEKFPSELSTGEKKRVGLARALVTRPKILLYDEPTTGMDPLVCEMIDELIVKVNHEEEALTSVVISHDLKAALATSDHIILLYKGRVMLSGSAAEFRSSQDPIVRQFFSGRTDGPMEFL